MILKIKTIYIIVIHFNPTEGKIIVFPSHLNHLVQENKSNEDRISVSFNIRLNKD